MNMHIASRWGGRALVMVAAVMLIGCHRGKTTMISFDVSAVAGPDSVGKRTYILGSRHQRFGPRTLVYKQCAAAVQAAMDANGFQHSPESARLLVGVYWIDLFDESIIDINAIDRVSKQEVWQVEVSTPFSLATSAKSAYSSSLFSGTDFIRRLPYLASVAGEYAGTTAMGRVVRLLKDEDWVESVAAIREAVESTQLNRREITTPP